MSDKSDLFLPVELDSPPFALNEEAVPTILGLYPRA